MATHSSVLAWRIPGTGEPGGLLSMGSHRIGHNWSDLAVVAAAAIRNSKEQVKWTIVLQDSSILHLLLSLPLLRGNMPGSMRIARSEDRVWKRQWHPIPVLLPGKSHGWRSLVGCNPWGLYESDMTERHHFLSRDSRAPIAFVLEPSGMFH